MVRMLRSAMIAGNQGDPECIYAYPPEEEEEIPQWEPWHYPEPYPERMYQDKGDPYYERLGPYKGKGAYVTHRTVHRVRAPQAGGAQHFRIDSDEDNNIL